MKNKSVTITDEQEQWLIQHTEINFSGFVQKALEDYIKSQSN
jgi:hypothetical protein